MIEELVTRQPLRALSIRQPWAWLIVNGHKDIENRTWKTHFRGQILVHAAKAMSWEEYDEAARVTELASAFLPAAIVLPKYEDLERGGIVGQVRIDGCVSDHPSPWFYGPVGFLLSEPQVLTFSPCTGAQGIFQPKLLR